MAIETATLGGGCFWCLEAVYDQLEGVTDVMSGYSGGHVPNPTYEQVCNKTTGHAEVVQVNFDNEVLSFDNLLDVFFTIHDPTQLNRQGNDVGPQYRSAIFYHSPEQKEAAEQKIKEIAGEHSQPIVTEVTELDMFYPAEDYHQEYFENHPYQPYCMVVVSPKVNKFKKKFAGRVKAKA